MQANTTSPRLRVSDIAAWMAAIFGIILLLLLLLSFVLETRAPSSSSTAGTTAAGRIAYFEAFGARDAEANAPMQTDAIFRIASQSKAIVSVAAMTLVEEGELLLTDPVGKYLPEFMQTKVAEARDGRGDHAVDLLGVADVRLHVHRPRDLVRARSSGGGVEGLARTADHGRTAAQERPADPEPDALAATRHDHDLALE